MKNKEFLLAVVIISLIYAFITGKKNTDNYTYPQAIRPIINIGSYGSPHILPSPLEGNVIGNDGSEVVVTPPYDTECSMEAKICPDGSSVGREGPKCDFAPCPDLKNN